MRRGGAEAKLATVELAGPEVPDEGLYLWGWFCELLSTRTRGESGPHPIGYGEIDAWARLTRRRPLPWEVSVLRDLDLAWLTGKAAGGDEG